MKQAINELIALDHSFGQVLDRRKCFIYVSFSWVLKFQDDLFVKLKKQQTNITNWCGFWIGKDSSEVGDTNQL